MLPILIYFLNAVFYIVDFILFFLLVYYTILGIYALKFNNKALKSNFIKKTNFILIVSAHNEENVIEATIDSINKVEYNPQYFKTIIICDNCTDNTYQKAKAASINNPSIIVLTRNSKKKGKNFAIEDLFRNIEDKTAEDTVFAFMDADNVMDKNFFKEMNNSMMQGHECVQGFIKVKNPKDTLLTNTINLTTEVNAYMYYLSRHVLGMPVTLGGNCFVITKKLLEKVKWDMESVTEDFELSCKLVSKGYHIAYNHNAITYDEKPLYAKSSIKQRERWMRGHFWVARKFSLDMIKGFMNSKTNKLGLFDYLIYMWVPTKTVFMAWIILLPIMFQTMGYKPSGFITNSINGLVIYGLIYIIYTLLELYFALKAKISIKNLILAMFYSNVHSIDWLIATHFGLLNINNQNWGNSKTEHNRLININDVRV